MSALRPMKLLQVDPTSTVASVNVAVEPTTGGASVQVPIPLTSGRDGFGPSLGLAFGGYDPLSPFPHGWSLAGLPSIDLDMRDGLPVYDGSERFRYQGQELVPLDEAGRSSGWTRGGYDVRAFRARVESVPIRAEQWTHPETGRVHWRVRTGDGTVQIFGRRTVEAPHLPGGTYDESRIADPSDSRRTFRWLLEAAYDRLGNAMVVRYEGENADDVDALSLDAARFAGATANRYPKRILYGNAAPLAEDADASMANWYFEAVFDYGDHDPALPQRIPSTPWPVRQDVGFTARPGFEIRTRRLCRRVLMFHHFATELGESSTLVGSLELDVDESPDASTLAAVRYVGWRRDGEGRVSQTTPWASFEYTTAGTEDAFAVLPAPLLGPATQLVDLFGEGLPGLLTLDGSGARYARNLGDGAFGAHEQLPTWPVGLEGATLADFDGDGNVELVQLTGPSAGYYRFDRRTRAWQPLRRFAGTLNTDPQQGSVIQADLSGDGRPDLVLLHERGLTWFPNEGIDGFGDPIEVALPAEKVPLANPPLDRFLADMTGDGLADIVEVLNGSVRYWPNLGRGRFGEPVVMDDAPRLDAQGSYDAARVLLLDLDQSGGADLIYLRGDGTVMRAPNHRGASFGPLEPFAWGAPIPNGARVELADLYGDGSSCLVVIGPSNAGGAAFHALRLTSATGARQMQAVTHPLGAITELEWGHSVRHYLRDVESGRGWDTPCPSQRPVVDVLRRTEPIDGVEQSERFVYHDGHYDPRERGFALFAVVEHLDVDTAVSVAEVIPLMTRRFAHTGEVDYATRFARHHYAKDLDARPPPSVVVGELLLTDDYEEAFRALTGTPVREEVYATDPQGTPAEHPFRVVASSRTAKLTRKADDDHRTALQVFDRDTLTIEYEQASDDPRETLARTLEVDAFLTPLVAFQAGLPRRTSPLYDGQSRALATASKGSVKHFDTEERFELAIPLESRVYEVHVAAVADAFATDFGNQLATALGSAIPYHQALEMQQPIEARELSHSRVYYWDDTQTSALSLGTIGPITLPHHTEEAAYDRAQLTAIFGTDVDPDNDLPALGYAETANVFYQVGPITRFGGASAFYRLEETEAFDGGIESVTSDAYHLVAEEVTDAVGNTTQAVIDYHVLAPWRLTDANGTVQEIDYDPLGIARRTSRYGTALDASSATVDHGFTALTLGEALPTFAAALAAPEVELGEAESLFLYEFPTGGAPMRTLALSAEELVDRGPDASSVAARAQVSLAYLDGFGRELQRRVLVEPGTAYVEDGGSLVEDDDVSPRWRVTGHIVYDAKQQVRQQFEPFFRGDHAWEAALSRRQFGVATTAHYDALGRGVRQDFPNGTFTDTTFTAWSRTTRDPNDSVGDASDYSTPRASLATTAPERIALDQALENAGTPVTVHLDALGREIATVEEIEDDVELTEQAVLEIRGLSEATIDRRELTASTRAYDRLGRLLRETSIDAGEHRGLFDAAGREVKHWHEDTEEERVYDVAGRLLERHVTHDSTSWLAERYTYGEGATGAADKNQLGRLIKVEDGAGVQETKRYGAFGEPLEVERTLTATPGLDPDWSGSVTLESSGYTTKSAFDALGRRARAFLPDGTERRVEHLRSGPVTKLQVVTPDAVVRTILDGVEYNARGQQVRAELGNDVEVSSEYDAETFRLYRRHAVYDGTDTYQDLRHHYDPVGNLVYLDDLAQRPTATHVINGLTVTAERVYRYDARYQLTEATGRVHNALTRPDYRGDAPTSGSFRGTRRVGLNDGGAVVRYLRTYSYDHGGNLLGWSHGPEGMGGGNSWTNEKWVSSTSNRSYLAKDLDGLPISDPASKFDARGQLTSLPNLRSMTWSPRDQLRKVVLIERPSDPDDDEVYDYAADSVRLRKVTRRLKSGNVETTETIYLDGCELRRVTLGSTVILERWSSHAEDGESRLATIYRWDTDTLARETDNVSAVRTHYHLGGKLGSVALEVGAGGEILSYEEYFPYGRTAFLAGDAVLEREIQFRTRRWVTKDQDDATGFYVFQYRYYAPFIGSWVSPDPAGDVDGLNRYWYARSNPVTLADSTGLQATEQFGDVLFLGPDAGWRNESGEWQYFQRRQEDLLAPWAPQGIQPWVYEAARVAESPERARPSTQESTPEQRRAATEQFSDRFSARMREFGESVAPSSSPTQPADPAREAREAESARLLAGGADLPSGGGTTRPDGDATNASAASEPADPPSAPSGQRAAEPGPESIPWGRLGLDGSVTTVEIPVRADADREMRAVIEQSAALANEEQAATTATVVAFLDGLTGGQASRGRRIAGATDKAVSLARAGEGTRLAAHLGGLWLEHGTGAGMALSNFQSTVHAAQAVDDWWTSFLDNNFYDTPGLSLSRLREPQGGTPEQRARQDEARGRRWSLPLQGLASAAGSALAMAGARSLGVRPSSGADMRLGDWNRRLGWSAPFGSSPGRAPAGGSPGVPTTRRAASAAEDPLLDNSILSDLLAGDAEAEGFAQANRQLLSVDRIALREALKRYPRSHVRDSLRRWDVRVVGRSRPLAEIEAEAARLMAPAGATVINPDLRIIASAHLERIPIVATSDTGFAMRAARLGLRVEFRVFDVQLGPLYRIVRLGRADRQFSKNIASGHLTQAQRALINIE